MSTVVGEAFIQDGKLIASDVIIKKKEIEPEDFEEFKDMIQTAIHSSCFTCKIIGKDSFTHKMYHEDDTKSDYINGCRLRYHIPGGLLVYSKTNSFMMDCANIEFMLMNNSIPYSWTNVQKKLFVKRSSGFIQHASVEHDNSFSLRLDEENPENNDIRMVITFNMDETKNTEYNEYVSYDASKSIYLSDYYSVNPNAPPLVFTFKYITSKSSGEYNGFIKQYNNDLLKFYNTVCGVVKQRNYPITLKIE